MCAEEILTLARRGGVRETTTVLDLCCGVAGPGRLIAAETGCDYLGVDACTDAVDLARSRSRGLPCRFETALVPPVPAGPFDVVILLETMLAFRDKESLLRGVADALRPGGRFVFTVEEGEPLAHPERVAMPDSDTVWLTTLDELEAALGRAGFALTWITNCSQAHQEMAERLTATLSLDRTRIAATIGECALDELVAAHRLWSTWLRTGRVRKFAAVAERLDAVAAVEPAVPDSRSSQGRLGRRRQRYPTREEGP